MFRCLCVALQRFLIEGGSQAPPPTCCQPRPLPACPQDLFFKYTWNNFLHLQVELCVAAILSHPPREDRAEVSGPESGDSESPLPAASHPESTMVTHVSPARRRVALRAEPGHTAGGPPPCVFFSDPHVTWVSCPPFDHERGNHRERA